MGKDVAFPGDFLGFEEEVIGDSNTFTDKGRVFSEVAGEKKIAAGKALISPKRSVRMIRAGDVVYGKVQDIYDSVSLVEITTEPADRRVAIGASYAYLRISELAKRYVNSFREFIKIGDMLKVKVIEVTSMGTYLTIAEPGLGVVKSLCSFCRHDLQPKGQMLVCPNCGNRETRKLA